MTFTETEVAWLARTVKKRAKVADSKDHKTRVPKLVKSLKGLAKKLATKPTEVELTRVELRILQDLVTHYFEFAAAYSIPAYTARLEKSKLDDARNVDWKKKVGIVVDLANMLAGLKNKLQDEI